ncbi:MAG: alpha-L-fucosidase [Planctomycetota bacterium]|jgi:alpha-L-fucosidase
MVTAGIRKLICGLIIGLICISPASKAAPGAENGAGENGEQAEEPDKPKQTDQAETPEQRDARMKWWREAKFGMFVHWGIYAIPAGEWKGRRVGGIGEWIMNRARIPVREYEKLASQFNPVKFDADEWVKLAKEAGMKYIVITAKHHDGFAMFHSEASKYNIVDATPFGRDPLKELAEACKAGGIKLGFYYSQAQDWHHPGGSGNSWDKTLRRVSMAEYIKEKAAPQVTELLTQYGDLGILWWDTPRGMNRQRAEMLRPLIKLQPDIITNNRLGGGCAGDYDTPEQHIPRSAVRGRDWETCMTMNNTWGYKKHDHNWKSTEDLVRKLVDIVSKGGNFLLNVGPTAEGLIPEPSVERLREMGAWLKVNGESVYATTTSDIPQPRWGRCTMKVLPDGKKRLYLHVFNWPEDGRLKIPLAEEPEKAYLLAEPDRQFKLTASQESLTVHLTGQAPDSIDSVVVLELAGEPAASQPDEP